MGWIEDLNEQGLTVVKGPGLNNTMAYYITDSEDGKLYILPYDDVEDIRKLGKLSREGIREHDEQIGKNRG